MVLRSSPCEGCNMHLPLALSIIQAPAKRDQNLGTANSDGMEEYKVNVIITYNNGGE